ncbi:hypothetical protein ARSEF1564_004476 [Beauveria bassiana]
MTAVELRWASTPCYDNFTCDMGDRADYDELAWDRFDQQRDQLQKQLFRLSTIKSLQDSRASNFCPRGKMETATIKFLSQHTNVFIPTLFSSGQHADVSHYIILEFVKNASLLSRALAQPNEDREEAPVLNMDMAGYELEAHLYNVAVHLRRLFQPSFPAIGSLAQTPQGDFKYIALAEMHMLQLAFQHNNLVKDEDDCQGKYVARHLFLKLARAGKLSTFGFSDDRAPNNTGPFRI